MLNRSASLPMSTSVLKALPCKLDIKRHSPSIRYLLSYVFYLFRDRAVTAFFETQNENVTHVLPIMTKPFDFKQQK